jgi:phosphoribosylaminoimidazolecarboxamide formyltransferase/IMP cyclohydrolase
MFENVQVIKDLSNGATISQSAKLFKINDVIDYTTEFELSYTDIINSTLGLNIASEFYDVCCAVFVKNNTLTSVALGSTIFDAFQKAIDANPIDSICGAVVLTKEVDVEIARLLTSQHIVLAPEFTKSAINVLDINKVKYVKIDTPLKDYKNYLKEEVIMTPFGTVVQTPNKKELDKDSFKVVSKTKPTVEQIEDAIFGWKISKYLRSSAVVIVKDFKTVGIAQGLQSNAFEYALDIACDNAKEAVLATDVPLTMHDLNATVQSRVSLIIQSGVRKEVLAQADKFEVSMITTGISNFALN